MAKRSSFANRNTVSGAGATIPDCRRTCFRATCGFEWRRPINRDRNAFSRRRNHKPHHHRHRYRAHNHQYVVTSDQNIDELHTRHLEIRAEAQP